LYAKEKMKRKRKKVEGVKNKGGQSIWAVRVIGVTRRGGNKTHGMTESEQGFKSRVA